MSLGSEAVPFTMPVEPVGSSSNNGSNSGWGGDWSAWIIIFVLFFAFGGWGNGFGGFGGANSGAQGALTRADLCSEFNFNGLENSVRGIQQGICDSTFALNNSINGLGTTVMQGFNSIGNAICNSEYQNAQLVNGVNTNMMQGFNGLTMGMMQGQNALSTQLADCCCKNQTGQMQIGNQMERGFCDVNYAQATNANAIIQNAHNDTDRVLAKLDAMEMSRKDEVIADLRTQLAQCGDRATADSVVARLTNVINLPAVPAYPAASPCGLGNWAPQVLANGWGGNCGCNNGCGC